MQKLAKRLHDAKMARLEAGDKRNRRKSSFGAARRTQEQQQHPFQQQAPPFQQQPPPLQQQQVVDPQRISLQAKIDAALDMQLCEQDEQVYNRRAGLIRMMQTNLAQLSFTCPRV